MQQAPATSLPPLDGYFGVAYLQAYLKRQNCRFQENVACKMPTIATSLDSCSFVVDFFNFSSYNHQCSFYKTSDAALIKFLSRLFCSTLMSIFSFAKYHDCTYSFFSLTVQKKFISQSNQLYQHFPVSRVHLSVYFLLENISINKSDHQHGCWARGGTSISWDTILALKRDFYRT